MGAGVGDAALAPDQAQSVDTLATESAQRELAETLLAAPDMNAKLGSALQALRKTEVAEAVSVMLWLYRRLPRGYGWPPHIEAAVERVASYVGITVAECLAKHVRGQNEDQTNGVNNQRT
ncbi:hypothetical protein [Massilia sp. TN1-12]|uniref:hypothetical protein n=1 Tax=Massilia paldalensis TaxID=3377675 RepID=UPI0038506547